MVVEVGSPADSLGTNLSLMMLKPRNSHPNHPSWPLMFKNVYYLGTTQINQEGFEVIEIDQLVFHILLYLVWIVWMLMVLANMMK